MTQRHTKNHKRAAARSPKVRRSKKPRTFSLSSDVVEVLESYRVEQGADSLTAALEEVVREWQRSRVAAQVSSYYDSINANEMSEDEDWGKFSESQM